MEAVAVSAGEGPPVAGDVRPSFAGRLARLWRHRWRGRRGLTAVFSDAAYERIEATISAGERRHRAEIRFAIEAELDFRHIRAATTPRERALQVFAEHSVWDTEENTGVLIYLLWADQAVEIVADRGVHRAIPAARWESLCAAVSRACREGRHVDGILEAIVALDQELQVTLPAASGHPDELPNRPIRL